MTKKIFSIGVLVIINISANAINSFEIASKDVSNQQRGNYAGMARRESIPLGAIQHIWDKSKGGVYDIEYKPNAVIKIRVREWMNTTIILPRWEKIQQVIVGNEEYIRAVQPKDNIVILKPSEVGADTNITIVAYNTYLLYARIEGHNSKNLPDIGVNIHAFPPRRLTNKTNKRYGLKNSNDWLTKPIISPKGLDFKFSMSGDRDIAPELVYSDGVRIWLYYGDKLNQRNLPVVFLVEDGVDTPVNNVVINESIVVSAKGILTLKNGTKHTCIYPSKLGRHSYVKK